MSEDLARNVVVQEVEIAYSEQALVHKLQSYALRPHKIYSKISVNLAKLKQVETSEQIQPGSFSFQLCEALKHWTPDHHFGTFTAYINQLIFLWLTAIQDGASSQSILSVLKCFELRPGFGFSASAKFHLFLFDLVAETAHQHLQLSLDYVLNYDTNTQLPNANKIISSLNAAIDQAENHQLFGLLSLHFQSARKNLTFSKLLNLDLNKQITKILQENIGASAQLYFSDDAQFDILIPNLSDVTALNLLAAKLSRAFEEVIFLNHQSILVSPFIGCAFTLAKAQNAHELYNNSKLALENAIAKQQPLVMYSEELKQQLVEQTHLEAKVLEAFDGDNLRLFFQPIVNLKNSKCVGAELLLRWSEKFGYNIYPSLTIEILNKVGKGKLFTRWLINSACRYASELIQDHKLKIYLTINLRAEDLYDTELPPLLLQAVTLWRLNPKDIILEITENGILEYNENSNSVISELSKNGFKFALDDFGTGFSSLSRLRNMPIDLIKIDQSFVRNITESKEDFEIVQSIAQLAKGLGKEVLAEGVEDEACLSVIKLLDIDKCQGYHFAKPMPFEQFIDWAKAH